MNAESARQNGRRLKTWKEIAAFFGCDERTVKRWEESRGLPVHRLPNGARSAVFAYEGELRAWLHATPVDDPVSTRESASAETPLPERPLAPAPGTASAKAIRWPAVGLLLAVAALAVAGLWLAVRTAQPGFRQASTAAHHVPNAEARKFYEAGLYGWQSRTPAGLTRGVDNFTQAIVRDPQYAQAYAGLANCYNLLRAYTAMPDDYAFPRAKAAAERAIALDPSLADAHAALGFVDFSWAHDIGGAAREYRTAIRLAPGNATAHHWYAVVLMSMRRFPEALAEIGKAQQLDSASAPIMAAKGLVLAVSGRTGEGADLLRQVEQTEPRLASPHLFLSVIATQQGDDAGFVREFSAYTASVQDPAARAVAQAASQGLRAGGHKGMLLAMLAERQRSFTQRRGSAYSLAQSYAQLGNAPEALRYLEISFQRRESDAVSLNIQPEFAALRKSPAFQQLVHGAGM